MSLRERECERERVREIYRERERETPPPQRNRESGREVLVNTADHVDSLAEASVCRNHFN